MTPQLMPPIQLAPDHQGMRVNIRGMLTQRKRGQSEMFQQLLEHLEELGKRYYAGDVAVVDEFLQLYCINEEGRRAVKAKS